MFRSSPATIPLLLAVPFAVLPAVLPAQAPKKSDQAKAVARNHIQVFGKPTRGHLQPVTGVHYRPDGKRALSCSHDGTIKIWNTRTGKLVRTLRGHTAGVWRAFFFQGGKKIISIGKDKTVRFFDADKGTKLRRIGGLPDKFAHPLLTRLEAAITPDGKELYFLDVGEQQGDRLLRFDLATMKRLDPIVIEGKNAIRHFAFSADGKHIVLAQVKDLFAGHFSLYDRIDKTVVYSAKSQRASRVAFHADGKQFLMVGPRAIETRKTADGSVVSALNGIADTTTGFAMATDGSRVYLGFFLDSVVLGIDIAGEKTAFQYGEFLDSVNALDLAPDGKTLLAGGTDGAVRFLAAADGKERFLPKWHQNRVQAVAVSADGKHVVSGTYDNEVVIWDAKSRRVKHELHEHKHAILGAELGAELRDSGNSDDANEERQGRRETTHVDLDCRRGSVESVETSAPELPCQPALATHRWRNRILDQPGHLAKR